jgi:hypothetical protein
LIHGLIGFDNLIFPGQEHFSLSRHALIEDHGEYSGLREYARAEDELDDPRSLALPDWATLTRLADALTGAPSSGPVLMLATGCGRT